MYLNHFLLLFLSLCVISSRCNKVQDDENRQTEHQHHHHENYDINNAPMPSLHDGPQHHVDRILPMTSTEKIKSHEQVHQHQFVHKIENSPLPVAHEGPQPLKMVKRSAPMALDNKFKDPKDGEETIGVIRELTSGEISMNPQKPKYADETTTIETGNNLMKDVYGYYGVNGKYGGRFEYKNQEDSFPGYFPTKNIGVVPPKNVKTRDYYNKISGLEPVFNQHGGVYSKFLEKNDNLPKYGNGDEIQFNSNAYQNVLNGLLMWNSMQNQNNNKNNDNNNKKNNFIFYTHENITKEINVSISIPLERIPCEKNQEELCSDGLDDVETFCTKEKYVFCTKKIKNLCSNNNKSCKNDEKMKCLKNVTLHNNRVFEDLCFISIVIAKV